MLKPVKDTMILEAINHGLNALGESPKKSLLFYLEKDCGIEWQKIPEDIEVFEEALKKLLGLGYNYLDSIFRQYLQEATDEQLSHYGSFADCVNCLRQKKAGRNP